MKKINKKILILGLCLLILAGLTVVLLKGFKVDLMLEQHETVNFIIGKEFDKKDVKQICDEVFDGKKVVLRNLELFNDAVNINVSSITDEEKENLVTKMNEKFGTTITSEDLVVQTVYNVRIRDWLRPYIKPICISMLLTIIYLVIRFRKLNILKLLGKISCIIIVTIASLASIIAITRFPISPVLINLILVIAVIELIVYINKTEKEYKNLN